MKASTVKSKVTSEQANFNVRNVPTGVYHKLITDYYRNFNRKYQLEVVTLDHPQLKDIILRKI